MIKKILPQLEIFKPARLLNEIPERPGTGPAITPESPKETGLPEPIQGPVERKAEGEKITITGLINPEVEQLNTDLQKKAKSYYEILSKASPAEIKALQEKAQSVGVSMTDLQGGWKWMGLKDEEQEKKYAKLAQAYLTEETNEKGQKVFRIRTELNDDYKTKYGIGAGDLLPPSIKTIEVTDLKKHSLTGTRGIVNGRVGYYTKEGNYIPIFGGFKIRPIDIIDETTEPCKKTVEEEKQNHLQNKKWDEENMTKEGAYTPPSKIDERPILGYKWTPEQHSDNPLDYQQVERKGVPEKLKNSENYVPTMGYKESFKYYEKIMGYPPASRWILRNFPVFGTNISSVNVVTACMLKELEFRCHKMGVYPKFNFITSYRPNTPTDPHGLGLSVDFDPKDNWTKTPDKTTWTIPLAMANEFQKMGFSWGMYYYTGRPNHDTDPMHFALQTTLPKAIGQLTSSEAIGLAKSFKVPGLDNTSLYAYAGYQDDMAVA